LCSNLYVANPLFLNPFLIAIYQLSGMLTRHLAPGVGCLIHYSLFYAVSVICTRLCSLARSGILLRSWKNLPRYSFGFARLLQYGGTMHFRLPEPVGQ
jgi:hypothetical protein